jgi:hypothetical protein
MKSNIVFMCAGQQMENILTFIGYEKNFELLFAVAYV